MMGLLLGSVYNMHTKKIRTNITIDKNLLEDARKYRISISGFVDVELRKYLALIRGNYHICPQNANLGHFC